MKKLTLVLIALMTIFVTSCDNSESELIDSFIEFRNNNLVEGIVIKFEVDEIQIVDTL